MRLYLAHHLKDRHDVLKWQKKIEKKTKLRFVNPFYDIHREDIENLDKKGVFSEENEERSLEYCNHIVDRDLEAIRKCDGLLAFVNKTIGTSMEIIMAYRVFDMPVLVISEKYGNHSWIRANSDRQFENMEEFEAWVETCEGMT